MFPTRLPRGDLQPNFGHHWHPPSSWRASLATLSHDYRTQLIVMAVVGAACVLAAWRVRGHRGWPLGMNPPATCLALGSAVAIGIATLTPRPGAGPHRQLQLIPLHTLRTYLPHPAEMLIYVGGNIALFVPLGFFLYLALNRRVWATTLACTLVSLGVEIVQLDIWSRTSDVDDVLTNAAGGFAGALAGYAILRLARRRQREVPSGEEVRYGVGSRAS